MVHDDPGFARDGELVAFHIGAKAFLRFLLIEKRVVLGRLGELVETGDRRVVFQHVQDESLLDRLFHGVVVVRPVLDLAAFLERHAEYLQRLVLRRGGKRVVIGVREHLPAFHQLDDLVLHVPLGIVFAG